MNGASEVSVGCGMVVGMKTIAIEFTLTAKATGQTMDDHVALRVILQRDGGGPIPCWLSKNYLGEQVWLVAQDNGPGPELGNLHLYRSEIVWWAMRLMAERMNTEAKTPTAVVVRESPNGSIVYHLGLV